MLLQVMNSKGAQPQAQVVGSSILPEVPMASTSAPLVQDRMSSPPYPRLDDKVDTVISPTLEVVPCSPISQMRGRGSPEVEASEVNVPNPMDVHDEAQGAGSPKIDPRLEDMAPLQATSPAAYGTTSQSLTFSHDVDEQKVDYEDSNQDICNNVSEGQCDQPLPLTPLVRKSPNTHGIAKVQPSDLYGFD